MDSFYEQPRSMKTSHSTEQFYPSPVVPEVSMIMQNTVSESSTSGDSMLMTYKAWKERNMQVPYSPNYELLKKQVRFENKLKQNLPIGVSTNQDSANTHKKGNLFEQIYLANIPSRQLDISVIESPKKSAIIKENMENINPNIDDATKRNPFYDCAKSNTIEVPQFEPKRNLGSYNNYKFQQFNTSRIHEKLLNQQYLRNMEQRCECNGNQQQPSTDSKSIQVFEKNSNEPTVNDLLKIIQQQNEQLLTLQRQVATLLNPKEMPKQIEAPPNQFERYQTSTQIEKPNVPLKRPMQQFSLDVMTSFEVSIRRQQNVNRACNYESKITEVTETSSKNSQESPDGLSNKIKPFSMPSASAEAVRNIENGSPSPANIIDIEMKDYSSDESSDEEFDENTNIGWTFYNNIMGQVNDIFKKSGIRPFPVNNKQITSNEISEDLFKRKVMKKVKQATVEHLKNIGVHVPAMDIADEPTGCTSNDSDPNNISFAVKQLLMKYLPDDQLSKVPLLQEQKEQPHKKQSQGLIKRRPEFSLATLQYMEKYNLLNDDNSNIPQGLPMQRVNNRPSSNFERILDITAIRQQPKLL